MSSCSSLRFAKVLVLEDDFYLADDTREALEIAGATVVGPFSDAADAIVAVDRQKPTCALVDINLGRGANFAPAKALLARGVPVIFVTGYEPEIIPAELQAAPVLQKPVETQAIIEAILAVGS